MPNSPTKSTEEKIQPNRNNLKYLELLDLQAKKLASHGAKIEELKRDLGVHDAEIKEVKRQIEKLEGNLAAHGAKIEKVSKNAKAILSSLAKAQQNKPKADILMYLKQVNAIHSKNICLDPDTDVMPLPCAEIPSTRSHPPTMLSDSKRPLPRLSSTGRFKPLSATVDEEGRHTEIPNTQQTLRK